MVLFIILIGLYSILKKYNLTDKRFILVLIILLASNITIAYKYLEAKSNMNTSAYISYNFTIDALSKIKYPNKMENYEDMMKLAGITREINKNLEFLEFNLRHSKLAHDNERFHSLINKLKDNLNLFIKQHNNHFATSKTFSSKQLAKYEKLKVELVMIEHYLSKLGVSQSSQFGIRSYNIGLKDKERYDWYLKLEERVSNIEKIVIKDLSLNTCSCRYSPFKTLFPKSKFYFTHSLCQNI